MFTAPNEAWHYYEHHRINGEIEYLPPRQLTPPPEATKVPSENPWPEAAGAFVVFHGTKPGPYRTW